MSLSDMLDIFVHMSAFRSERIKNRSKKKIIMKTERLTVIPKKG